MSKSVEGDPDDLAWLQIITERLAEDRNAGLPEPVRLRELATDNGRLDLAVSLLQAFTPRLLPTSVWQAWFDGGASPREILEPVQFAPGKNTSKRKIADAAGVYEESRRRVDKAKAAVVGARRELEKAEQELAQREADMGRAAAKAQGAIMWSLLREVSRRVDALYATGPAAKLIDVILEGLLPQDVERILRDADADDAHERLSPKDVLRAQRAQKVLEALKNLDVGDVELVRHLRAAVLRALEGPRGAGAD